jgi:hypothetical protein
MPAMKPVGHSGSWFATWEGLSYPCVHNHWHRGEWYDDPCVEPAIYPKWQRFLAAIQNQKKVIETIDKVPDDWRYGRWRRSGYIGLWEVDNFQVEHTPDPNLSTLRFRFVRILVSFHG